MIFNLRRVFRRRHEQGRANGSVSVSVPLSISIRPYLLHLPRLLGSLPQKVLLVAMREAIMLSFLLWKTREIQGISRLCTYFKQIVRLRNGDRPGRYSDRSLLRHPVLFSVQVRPQLHEEMHGYERQLRLVSVICCVARVCRVSHKVSGRGVH